MSYLRKEQFAWDPIQKKSVVWHELDRGEEWAIETKVDVTDIVEANKAEYAQTDVSARWGKPGEVWAKVGSIPNHLWFRLVREGVIDPQDDASILRWLQGRDNIMFRTRPGRLI